MKSTAKKLIQSNCIGLQELRTGSRHLRQASGKAMREDGRWAQPLSSFRCQVTCARPGKIWGKRTSERGSNICNMSARQTSLLCSGARGPPVCFESDEQEEEVMKRRTATSQEAWQALLKGWTVSQLHYDLEPHGSWHIFLNNVTNICTMSF